MGANKAFALTIFLIFMLSSASARYCGEGDRGGKLLEFTVSCFGSGELIIYCSQGTERPQCYERKSCDVAGCGLDPDGEYETGCRAKCEEGTTYVGITCQPLPVTSPAINIPFEQYSGIADKNFVVEGFAADNQFIEDLYFEPVADCDLNQVKEGLGTESASVKTTFNCNKFFTQREIKLVAEDGCGTIAEDTALLSIEKWCPKECIPRIYPQCRQGQLVECIEDNSCTFLSKTDCEHGCTGNECCVPLGCSALGFECGLAFNNCDENISCGDCSPEKQCIENKCQASLLGLPVAPLDGEQPFPFGFDPILIIVAIVIVAVVGLILFLHFRE